MLFIQPVDLGEIVQRSQYDVGEKEKLEWPGQGNSERNPNQEKINDINGGFHEPMATISLSMREGGNCSKPKRVFIRRRNGGSGGSTTCQAQRRFSQEWIRTPQRTECHSRSNDS